MNNIILFKSSDNCEKYLDVFSKHKYHPIFVPVLDFAFVNLEELFEKLKNYSLYDGLVITSQRAVEAIVRCLKNDKHEFLENWKRKPVFVVGETTNEKLLSCLSLQGCGQQSGNATNLSEFIVQQHQLKQYTRPLLFPCGNLKSEVLPDKLKQNNIMVDSITTYITQESSSIRQDLMALKLDKNSPHNFVFFSPSGVGFLLPILNELNIDLDACAMVAIGPSTEKKILQMGHQVRSVAKEPTPDGIISCFINSE